LNTLDIKDYLRSFQKHPQVSFCPNPGLAGDELIACAAYQLFRRFGISHVVVDGRTCDPDDKIIFFGGGGNFVMDNSYAVEVIARVHHRARQLIVLPHTIIKNEDLLGKLESNVTVICREPASWEHVKKNAPRANVMLCDDMVFNLNVSTVLSPSGRSWQESLFKELQYLFTRKAAEVSRRPTRKELAYFLAKETALFKIFSRNHNGILNCFRTDDEKTDMELPADNIDLPRLLGFGRVGEPLDETVTLWLSNQFLRLIDRYQKVRTNRLHVGIAAALLNKEVDLFRNSYFKNEAIYRYTIEKRFPRVRWMG